jgi:hypothetical protein
MINGSLSTLGSSIIITRVGVKCFNILHQSQHFSVDFSLYINSSFIILQTRTYEVTTQKLEYGLINLFCALGTC